MIPQILEHHARSAEQRVARHQLPKEALEVAFDHIPSNGLAVADTAARLAKIVRMALTVPSSGPAPAQRIAAIGAGDKPTQRKILVEILAVRHAILFIEPLLDLLEVGIGNQPLVVAFPARYVHACGLDVARIHALTQHHVDPLEPDEIVFVLRKQRMRLQEQPDISGLLESAGGVPFQSFLHHRGDRFIAHQHHAAPGHLVIAIAARCGSDVIPVLDALTHTVARLLRILAAMMF